jgi:hypothetical protein
MHPLIHPPTWRRVAGNFTLNSILWISSFIIPYVLFYKSFVCGACYVNIRNIPNNTITNREYETNPLYYIGLCRVNCSHFLFLYQYEHG